MIDEREAVIAEFQAAGLKLEASREIADAMLRARRSGHDDYDLATILVSAAVRFYGAINGFGRAPEWLRDVAASIERTNAREAAGGDLIN